MGFDIAGLLDLWSTPYADREKALAAFGAWYADPVVINGAAMSVADLADRADQVRTSLSDVRREILDVCEQPIERGTKVAVAFRMGGRHTGVLGTAAGPLAATGQELTIRVIDLITVEDGLITSLWMSADELGALAAVGAATLKVPG
jgi:ketosteroid isomerase-like protein